jgi:D-galactarolactone cycloisomerase
MMNRDTEIVNARVYLLIHDLDEPRGVSCAWASTRESVLVQLTDRTGVSGWGEAGLRPGVVAATQELSTMTVGRQPQEARALADLVGSTTADRWAISGLSIAIDDLRARQLGVSVAALYGGARRTRVRAYASSGGYEKTAGPEETWPREIAETIDAGFTAYKFRIGRFSPRREMPILERVCRDLPTDFVLLADGNGAYALPRAIEVGRVLERLGFRWLEEPVGRQDARLPDALDIAVAGGEGLETRNAFADYLARGAADIVQPDVAICGGIGDALFVAELGALQGRSCAPHCWGGGIVIAATLQLHALLPDASRVADMDPPLMEYDIFENPMRTELTREAFVLQDGCFNIPTGPGLGIEVDEEFVARMDILKGPSPAVRAYGFTFS